MLQNHEHRLKKRTAVSIIYILLFGFIGCTVSLVNARVPFIILAGLSQYLTVLSQVVNYCSICDSSVNKHINTSDDNFYIDNGTSLSSSSSSSESSFSPQVNPTVGKHFWMVAVWDSLKVQCSRTTVSGIEICFRISLAIYTFIRKCHKPEIFLSRK